MLKIVEQDLDTRERAALSFSTQMKRQSKDLPTATAWLSKDLIPNRIYCDQSHSSLQCKAVTGVGKRKQMLLKSGCCFFVCERVIMRRTVALP